MPFGLVVFGGSVVAHPLLSALNEIGDAVRSLLGFPSSIISAVADLEMRASHALDLSHDHVRAKLDLERQSTSQPPCVRFETPPLRPTEPKQLFTGSPSSSSSSSSSASSFVRFVENP
eukprot:NODE_1872_length_1374_cov_21.854340_g1693_i0.p2 GENE.NODE_1872_length_1374_cov_21.854340_g1693_i0~~NODE_1872_length_1374_cov_21.854340_g1693_i0.p2  ORF type:complete len:118 (-),score=21.38 NODE_1872_length_1374_cov_21.854340_g1693_i0:777-1130(-)